MAVYKAPKTNREEPEEEIEEAEHSKSHIGCFVLILVLLVAFLAAGFFAFRTVDGEIKGKNAQPSAEITLEVEQGSGTSAIADQLKEAGVIRFPQLFKLYIKTADDAAGNLQYGSFNLYAGMSYDDIIDALTSQLVYRDTVRLTFPEGSTSLAIAQEMEDAGLCTAQEFLDTACAANGEDYSQFAFYNRIDQNDLVFFSCEGYLFPDTYDFYTDDTVYNYVCTFYQRFDEMFTDAIYSRMDECGYTLNELVTLASFITEEAGPDEAAKVSAVFTNRLAADSPLPMLQSNASSYVQNDEDNNYLYNWIAGYYGGFDQIPEDKFKAYDTYQAIGLTPGAISNPGMYGIEAALYPDPDFIENKYYFFVTDSNGKYYYAQTAAEHEANVAAANAVG